MLKKLGFSGGIREIFSGVFGQFRGGILRLESKNFEKIGIFSILSVFLMVFGVAFSPAPAFAEKCAGVETSLINCDVAEDDKEGGGIFYILSIVLNILTFGVGAAGVLGIVISGVQYMSASGNEVQMTKAKNRIVQVVIGLVAYGLFWAVLEWLIPGGIL
ncbi:hypothetical protein IKG02_01115 [Candidatus Saccharibacteria bacterium]|nr:hypothetical protein [Candidatus Saccharibacteria bacterium]